MLRRRLQFYLPVCLFAMMVQIIAPIGASWAAAIVASDPLAAAEICHSDGASPSDHKGDPQHDQCNSCSMRCLSAAATSADTPHVHAFPVPYFAEARIIWLSQALVLSASRAASGAQARAPPTQS